MKEKIKNGEKMLYIILAIVCVIAAITIKFARKSFNKETETLGYNRKFPIPQFVNPVLWWASVGLIILGLTNGAFYMQEPRESVFVRDIAGQTHVNFDTGWHVKGFGTTMKIKKEMTAAFGAPRAGMKVSYQMPPKSAVFLDQVTADISATVRIVLPSDDKNFRLLIEKFGSADNVMASLMIPSIERTIDATTGLMTAEKYFSGGKTEFMNEFDKQMRHGLYVVDIKEKKIKGALKRKASQNAAKGENQDSYENEKVVFEVVKRLNQDTGMPMITPQEYAKYGISIASAIIVEMDPNAKFDSRMEKKQQASADLAIAREAIKNEVAQKQLAIAKGERESATAQAEELKIQVRETTKAQTTKQLAITKANQMKESMKIQEDTALIQYRRDQLSAKSIKVLADANAYDKKVTLKANGALELKLATYERVMDRQAQAIENRKVPASLIMMGGSGSGNSGDLAGSSSDIGSLLEVIAAKAAKDLALDMTMSAGAKSHTK